MNGTTFTYKINIFEQARALKNIACRKPGRGLDFDFTGKGSRESTEGNVAHFMAVVAYGKGVIAAEQYHGRIDAEKFSSCAYEHFASMFKKSAKPGKKLVVSCRST